MSENYTIKALQRDTKTKSVGKKLRNEGYALASLYGRGKEYSIAVELKEFYNEIMIDEYQDTNDLQEEFSVFCLCLHSFLRLHP